MLRKKQQRINLTKEDNVAYEKSSRSKTKINAEKKIKLGNNKFTVRKKRKGLFYFIYANCYILGIKTKIYFKRLNRKVSPVTKPIGRFIYRPVNFLLVSPIKGLRRELKHMKNGFKKAGKYFREAYNTNKFLVIPEFFTVFFKGIIHSKKLILGIFNYTAPVVSALVLAFVITTWVNIPYGLAVNYNGENIGYISDEKVFDTALHLLESRVVDSRESVEITHASQFYLSIVGEENLDTSFTLCDKLISNSNDVTQAAGLYIADELVCAAQDTEEINKIIDETIEKKKIELKSEKISFVDDIKVQSGIYPSSLVVSSGEIKEKISGNKTDKKVHTVESGDTLSYIAETNDTTVEQIEELNENVEELLYPGNEILIQNEQPNLDVKSIAVQKRVQSVPFKTVKQENIRRSPDYNEEIVQGINGQEEVSEEVEYINGLETSRKIINIKTIRNPVDKVVEIGATKDLETIENYGNKEPDIGTYTPTGKYIWPVAGGFISSNYGQRKDPFGGGYSSFHKGLDIAAPYGTKVLAADAGKVELAGWYSGYGLCVIIDHGGGNKTLYGHNSAIDINEGQIVSKGQAIAKIGSTGNSTGNHCHFEIIENDLTKDPLDYIQ